MGEVSWNYAIGFFVEQCCNCGMAFAMSADFRRRKKELGDNFYCPAGHPQHYTEGDIEKLKKQLEQEQKRRQWAEEARDRSYKSAASYQGQVTKLKNRIGNGVCPCCKRSFQNLKKHINHMHPKFKEE